MSHDAILKHRQNPPAECRIRLAGEGLYLSRSSRNIGSTVWFITPTSLPIPSGCSGNRCASLGRLNRYPNHDQNTRRCCEPASVTCANQRHDYWRDSGTGHRQFSRQAAPPWLIAIVEVYVVSWNLLLIVCMPLNWSRSLPSWFRTGNAALMNPQD
jgi:hypothetical protein